MVYHLTVYDNQCTTYYEPKYNRQQKILTYTKSTKNKIYFFFNLDVFISQSGQ